MRDSIRSVAELLTRRIGLDPATVGEGLIARAILERMTANRIHDPASYAKLAASSETELGELVELVVVPESWFFRDVKPFELLGQVAKSAEMFVPSKQVFRVLSVPCANGEEPYSIALTLLDAGLPPDRFHVDAADVSQRALAKSARAVYSRNAFRNNNHAFRDRYFQPVGKDYVLDEAVRELVQFHHANPLETSFFASAAPYHAIFCRNLIIYLDNAARKQVMDSLYRLLTPDGLLFVGHAEATPRLDTRFEAIDDSGSFAYRRTTKLPEPALENTKVHQAKDSAIRGIQPRPSNPIPKQSVVAVVSTPLNSAPVSKAAPQPSSSLLEQASSLANARRHVEAIQLCEQAIQQSGPKSDAYLLMGMIYQATGSLDQAEAALSKAVYLDPTHSEALLSLALLSDRRGDTRAAASYRRRVDRARRTKEPR
jgi:chemotaxis protein methyltransferase WspC